MTKNPLQVSHDDMLKQAQNRLKYMQTTYPAKVNEGSMTSHTATRQIAIQEAIVKFLIRNKPVKQTRLF